MENPMVLAALFLALVASANAMTVQTTITTTTTEEEVNPGQQIDQQCRERMQAMQLRECMRYMSQGSEYALRMVVNQQGPMLSQCCMKLRSVPEQCRCGSIKEMMRMMQERQMGQVGERQMKQMMQKARFLPEECNMAPHVCQF